MTERIRVEGTGDFDDLRRELRTSRAEINAFAKDVERSRRPMQAHARDTDRSTVSVRELSGAASGFNKVMLTTRNTVQLVKWPALITGAGLAGGALNSAAAGAVALTGSLTPLVGLLPAAGQGLTAFAQGLGVVKFATMDLKDAFEAGTKAQEASAKAQDLVAKAQDVGKTKAKEYRTEAKALREQSAEYRAELDKLAPAERAMVEFLLESKGAVEDLQDVAAQGLLPGALDGLQEAKGSLGEVRDVVRETSDEFGIFARNAGELVGSSAWGKDIKTVGESNALVLERGGRAALDLADAARHLVVEATPLTEWLALSAARLANLVERELEVARETGELAEFFDEAREKAARLASITGSLASGLKEVAAAGKPLGDDILEDLDAAAQRWENWTQSMEGQNELRAYFDAAKPTLYEAGRLVDDLTTGFLQMGSSPATAELIRQLRVELLPVIFELIDGTTEAFGPHLVDALVQVTKLFVLLAGESGPLVLFIDTIGAAASAMNDLLEQFPILRSAIFTIMGTVGIYKALQIGAAITGMKTLHGLLKATPKLAAGAGAAGAAAGAGGAAAAGAAGGAGGSLLQRVAPRVLPRAVPAVGAYLAFNALLQTGVPKLEDITQKLDQFNAPGPENTRLKQLTRDLDEAVKAGDASRMRKIATAIAQVGKATEGPAGPMIRDVARDVRLLATEKGFGEIKRQVTASAREFDIMREQTTGDIRAIQGAVSINAMRISADLGRHSREGKAALATNFRQAAEAVKQSMQDGTVSTKAGLREIERLMTQALRLYGFSPKQARNIARTGDPDANKGREGGAQSIMNRATGGYVGKPGERGHDQVPIALPSDWAVINAHQQAALGLAGGGMVPALVGRGELLASPEDQAGLDDRARQAGYMSLDDVFSRVTRPHYLATGGRPRGIVPIPGQPGEFIHQSILGDVLALVRRYRARVTDGYAATGHAAGGDHPKGLAVDLVPGASGSWEQISQLARWAEPRQGQPRFPFRWVGYTGDPAHGPGDHLHLSWLAGARLKGGFGDRIKRVVWKGPGGTLGAVGQRALDQARSGAQFVIDQAAGSTGGLSGATGGGTGAGAASRSQMVEWAREALTRTGIFPPTPANIEKILTLARQESGWVVRSINQWDSNAKAGNPSGGLMHVTLDKVGGSYARLYDPVDNMMTSIRYQSSRYGKLVTFSPYARGKRGLRSPRAPNMSQGRGKAPGRGRARRSPRPLQPLSGINLGRLDAFDDRITAAEGNYGRVERGHGLTDESPTRQIALPLDPAALADVLAAQPLEAGWIQSVNARGEEMEVEVRDEPGIAAHVSELRELQGLKAVIAALVRKQKTVADEVVGELRAGIVARVELLEKVKRQLQNTIEALRKARDRIHRRNQRIKDLRRGRENAAQRRQIRALTEANTDDGRLVERLTGRKRNLESEISGRQGTLSQWRDRRDQVKDRQAAYGGTLADLQLDVDYLQKDINQWTGTTSTAPKLGAGESDSARASLLEQMLEESRRANFRQAQQFGALAGFAPLLAGRMVGSFAHGTLRVPETGMALVHRHETIIPDAKGPYGSQLPAAGGGQPIDIRVTIQTDKGEVIRIVRTEISGGAQRVVSQQTGRTSRLISAAPGR